MVQLCQLVEDNCCGSVRQGDLADGDCVIFFREAFARCKNAGNVEPEDTIGAERLVDIGIADRYTLGKALKALEGPFRGAWAPAYNHRA